MAYFLKIVWRGARLASSRSVGSLPPSLVFSEEVLAAKSEDKPIVALESTIITHGMPYPKNLETALEVENIIRKLGVVPATVAILKGQMTIGLSEDQIKELSQAKSAVKASRRDLAPIMATGLDGATTVAGTIVAAELADIPIFVTGGIGGVHREGENTLDISADLNELGRSKTLVVCSGAKSILDIGRTLEYLETQGVCVCTYGKNNDFPAFYTTRSGYKAPYNVESPEHAARILKASHALNLQSGIVVAVPLPEEYAMDEKTIENAIQVSLEDAKNRGIKGKEVTPFILSAVGNVTSGASLEANIALIKNNAKVGSQIAVEFKNLKRLDNSINGNIRFSGSSAANARRHFHTSSGMRGDSIDKEDLPLLEPDVGRQGDVLVIGGANMDRTYKVTEDDVQLNGSTHPCKVEQCGGGVGRNMAEALWRLRGGKVRLLTTLGDDADGQHLAGIAPGLILDGSVIKGGRTATYAAVLDAMGDCRLGLGDMNLHDHISIDLVNKHMEVLRQAPIVVIDGNIPQTTIDHVLQICNEMKKPVFFEPTDKRKAIKAIKGKHRITYASPNLAELCAMATYLEPKVEKTLLYTQEILKLCTVVLQKINFLIVTMGSKGVITVRKTNDNTHLDARLYPVNPVVKINNVSGAGDCFSSGFVNGILEGQTQSQCISMGFAAAKCALLAKVTVPNNLKEFVVKENMSHKSLNVGTLIKI
ncbi:hypothetical protein ACJJTC_009831 [Scirpophaga incertulas]